MRICFQFFRDESVYHIRFVNNEIRVSPQAKQEAQTQSINNESVVFNGTHVQKKFYHEFDQFFTDFANQMRLECSTQKQADAVFNLCEILVQKHKILCASLLQEKTNNCDFH